MPARVELFGVEIDPLRMDEAVAQIKAWVADSARRCHFVVTPNVDHVVMLQHHAGLRAAYRDAGMVLADGTPVLWSSRILRGASGRLPERVAGSDLVPALFSAMGGESAGGGLHIKFDATPGMEGSLEHVQYDTFRTRWTDRDIEDAYLTFDLTPTGEIDRIRMQAVSPAADFSFDYQDLSFVPEHKQK